MTLDQIDYLWELARRDGDDDELRAIFPDVDWDAAHARRQARRQAREEAAWAARSLTPTSGITLEQINEVTKKVVTRNMEDRFTDSPLLDRLRGRR